MDKKWWTLLALCTGTFMLLLDVTVINVALPDIQRSLNASFSDLQWVIDAYALSIGALFLTAGVVGDMIGRRRVFAAGLLVFSTRGRDRRIRTRTASRLRCIGTRGGRTRGRPLVARADQLALRSNSETPVTAIETMRRARAALGAKTKRPTLDGR